MTELEPPIVVLCRWLKLLDAWATYYETDPNAAQRPSREDLSTSDRAQSLYVLKERSIQTLYASQSPAVSLGILEGPPTTARVILCDSCRRKARDAGMPPNEYALKTGGCKHCTIEGKEADYFSLYVLSVDYSPLGRWHFHTPVPIGKHYFPEPRTAKAPIVGKRPLDREGRMQRLGTAISKEERRMYPEHEVVWNVWQAIKRLKRDA